MSNTLDKVKEKIKKYDMLLKLFNMKVDKISLGHSEVSMEIKDNHTNAAGVCHGGVIFSLADVAFALASNSYGTIALAMDVSISFIKTVKPGTKIHAVCDEKHRGKSTAQYIIEVKNDKDKLVSFIKATAFRFEESIL